MAVSRQVDRRAVGRNRIKRIIRESFRTYFRGPHPGSDPHGRNVPGPDFPALDLVVLPRRESATMSNKRLTKSLCEHWDRLSGMVLQDAHRRRVGHDMRER